MVAHTKGSHITTKGRLKPPAKLSPGAQEVFTRTVAAVDPSHFSKVDEPLLMQYAQAADLCQVAQAWLDRTGVVLEGGKVSPWLAVMTTASKSCVALAARLRVCPQSRFDRLVAGANTRPQFAVGSVKNEYFPDGLEDDDFLAK